MDDISRDVGSGNVFADMGFGVADAQDLTAKTVLILAVKDIMAKRNLTQKAAAEICGTDQDLVQGPAWPDGECHD